MREKRQPQPEPWVHYTLNEEIANSVTHGIGTAFSIAGLTLLVTLAVQQHDPLKIASFAIYGMSLVILHLASTLYHALRTPWVKRLFRIFDHCSIYLLIAGTYTPFLLIGLHDSQGFLLLGVVWGLAALGIILQIALKGWFGKLSVLPYIGMGWLVVIIFRKLMVSIPFNGFILLIAGGVAYMVGIIFYGWKKLRYHHAIWHLFVLAGSACYFFAILFHLVPEG